MFDLEPIERAQQQAKFVFDGRAWRAPADFHSSPRRPRVSGLDGEGRARLPGEDRTSGGQRNGIGAFGVRQEAAMRELAVALWFVSPAARTPTEIGRGAASRQPRRAPNIADQVSWRYELTRSTDDFDDAGLALEGSGDVPFREATMLLCEWWYPTREQPLCVVEAVHVTRAEPTEAGVRVAHKLTLIAKPMPRGASSGVSVSEPSVHCALDESQTAAAMRQIEAGMDPLYFRFKAEPTLDKALSTQVEPLAAIHQRLAMEDLLASSEREKPPAAKRI